MIEWGLSQAEKRAKELGRQAFSQGKPDVAQDAAVQLRAVQQLISFFEQLQQSGVKDIPFPLNQIPPDFDELSGLISEVKEMPPLEERIATMSDRMKELHQQHRDESLGDLLQRQRSDHNFSQTQVAQRIAKSPAYICLLERNKRDGVSIIELTKTYLEVGLGANIVDDGLPKYTIMRAQETVRIASLRKSLRRQP